MAYSQEEKDKFSSAVDSLKKYRRAELKDEKGNDILENLYTDLLPNNQILRTCLRDNTTFLIGRKGTGKSTIFQKLENEYRKKHDHLSCYIDVKTVFEQSKTDYVSLGYLDQTLPGEIAEKYLIERTFIQAVLTAIIKELEKRFQSNIDKFLKVLKKSKPEDVKKKLSDLKIKVDNNEKLKEIELPLLTTITKRNKTAAEDTKRDGLKTQATLDITKFGIGAGVETENEQSRTNELETQFSNIFLKVFQIKDLIEEIKNILSLMKIKHLIILLDDFSEVDDSSLKTFVDVILAPLNNWSDEFIKFKIAAYPTRIYFGKIDPGKIDTIDLDFYNLYSKHNRDTMEKQAADFTKRLIEKRIEHFAHKPAEYYFDTRSESIDMDGYYELIFQISSNVPRIIGYILLYCYNNSVVYDRPITRRALESAAAQYYKNVIKAFVDNSTHSIISLDEKMSIMQISQLLDTFIDRLKDIKRKIINGEMSETTYAANRRNPFCSHFHFQPNYENFIKTLELNFFVTKYNELSGRDGGKQSIYALNYGLCVENNLRWGKPKEDRKYFILRPFDFNELIDSFLRETKKIVCTNPNHGRTFTINELEFLKFTNMRCPDCQSQVEISSFSEDLQKELEKIDQNKLLPPLQRSILYELYKSDESLKASEIGEELDRSYQLIGKQVKKMDEEKGLVNRYEANGVRLYKLTPEGRSHFN